jgi:hypothetical protein
MAPRHVRRAAWLLLIGLLPVVQAAGEARFFRYRDERGVLHVGNILPPGQAQAGYEVLDGRTLKTLAVVRPAPSAEELAQQASHRQETLAAEVAARNAERASRREADQRQYRDNMLLQTYASEADLISLRDAKLETLDQILRTIDNTIGHLRGNLAQMDATIAEHRAAGRPPPAALLAARARTAADLEDQERAGDRTRADQVALRTTFDADIARYRALTGTR